jgi:hypothetical protein
MALKLACVSFMAGLALVVAGCDGGTEGLNLYKVDWADVTLPGSICGASRPIRLQHHQAVVASTRWPPLHRIYVDSGWNRVVYGDLDGDGQDEAALVVDCNNGGGTANGVLAYAQVIFATVGDSLRVIGVTVPQEQPPNQLPTLVTVSIRLREIVAHEAWYGPNDGTCCPSGRATTTWTYAHGTLKPSKFVIDRRPRAARARAGSRQSSRQARAASTPRLAPCTLREVRAALAPERLTLTLVASGDAKVLARTSRCPYTGFTSPVPAWLFICVTSARASSLLRGASQVVLLSRPRRPLRSPALREGNVAVIYAGLGAKGFTRLQRVLTRLRCPSLVCRR